MVLSQSLGGMHFDFDDYNQLYSVVPCGMAPNVKNLILDVQMQIA